MSFLEQDLENIIYKADSDELVNRGLYIEGKFLRQQSIGNYGIADLITYYRHFDKIVINVIELKKDSINLDAFYQAVRYVRGIQEYIFNFRDKNPENYVFEITLIGRKIDDQSTLVFIPDVINNPYQMNTTCIKFYKYKYEIKGIYFEEIEGYKLTENGFK